jgi:hypothetical protein
VKFRPYGAPSAAWLAALRATATSALDSSAAPTAVADRSLAATPDKTVADELEIATDLDAFTVT